MRFYPIDEPAGQAQPESPAPQAAPLKFYPVEQPTEPPPRPARPYDALTAPPPKEIVGPGGSRLQFPDAAAAAGFERSLKGRDTDPDSLAYLLMQYGGKTIAPAPAAKKPSPLEGTAPWTSIRGRGMPLRKPEAKPLQAETVIPTQAAEPPPYKDRREALDDAVNMIEEGANQAAVAKGFEQIGVKWDEIVQHGKQRKSEYFKPGKVWQAGPAQPAAPMGQVQPREPGYLESAANVFKRADTNFKDMATSFLFSAGAFSPDDVAWQLSQNARNRAAAAPSEDIQRGMQAIGNAKTYGDAAQAMLRNPKATFSMLLDSLLVTAPTLAATLAVAPAGAATRAGLTFAGSGTMEYSSVMTDVLRDKGIDLMDPAKVSKALQDPKIISEMKEKGAKRGLIVGAFDALSMGLAGRFMQPATELIAAGKLTGSAARKATVAAWGKELALQAGLGGGGEFAAQQATGENKPADVLMEALAETVTAPVDVAMELRNAQLMSPEAQIARAIQAGVEGTNFTPEGMRQEAIGAAQGIRPATIAELARTIPDYVPPPSGRVEPTLGAGPAAVPPEERREPTMGGRPPAAVEARGRVEPSIPGMPTGEEIEEPSVTNVTPEEPAAPPSVTNVTPSALLAPKPPSELPFTPIGRGPQFKSSVPPTAAAARLPDTPTVAPTKPIKPFEPAAPQHQEAGFPSVEVPLDKLTLSKEVPQFKYGANASGVVKPLGGKFSREGLAPIAVWERLDGSLEIISGRHRFDLAKRSGEKTIPAQIYRESDGFTAMDAAIKDAELNIRDDQGQVKDYVNYFKESGMDRETAESKGLLARDKGKRGFTIGNQGSDELIDALRADQITDTEAYYIALNAPNDSRLQAVGIKAIMDGKSANVATNIMQAVKALATENDTTVDMFGFDDSAIKEAEEMAKIAQKKQREVQDRLAAITGAAKRPEIAKAEGIDVKDPEAIKRRIEELRGLKAAWDNWSTNPDLIAQIRAARGTPAPTFELVSESEAERRAREAKEAAEKEEKERKRIADQEVDLFGLTPPPTGIEEPPTGELFGGENAPSAEYQAAAETFRRASAQFRKVQEAYRKQEIGDDEFLAARTAFDKATAEFDKATRKEQGLPEPEEKVSQLQKAYDKAKADLEELGPEPPKPSPEKRFFGEAGRAGASPELIEQYDKQVKRYNAWKRRYNTLKKKEVEASNALFRSKQKPDQPDEESSGVRGASDADVKKVADAFQQKSDSEGADPFKIFQPPQKQEIVRAEDKARVYVKGSGYMTVAEAKKRIEQWKKHADAQRKGGKNSDKVVLSLFDLTGEWSKPWEDAGYQVYRFDIQADPEIGDVRKFDIDFFSDMFGMFDGNDIYAILAACPCTDFASSGARHFAAKDADGRTLESVDLVRATLATIELFKPAIWAIENPVGRIENLTGLPPWRLSFNPNHFGDPYTKKTLLWGRFNADLPVAPVEPTEGSKMHRKYGGKSQATKNARSVTPEGFAYSFFMANNAIDHPVMALSNKYSAMDPKVFQRAIDAGMKEKEISYIIEDDYYDLNFEAAEETLKDRIDEILALKALGLDVPKDVKTGDDVRQIPLPDDMLVRVFKTSDGYGTGLFDVESGNYVDGSIIRYKGKDALDKANKRADDLVKEATPVEPGKDAESESAAIDKTIQDQLKKMADDFMVGDLVRMGNVPGVVVGVDGDYVRFRPDSAKSPKAYQRIAKKSLTFVARPDTSGNAAYAREHDNKFGEEAGQLNANMGNLIQLLGANMYASALSDVSIKELLQNAFDAVKGATVNVNSAGKKIAPLYKSGNIEISIDSGKRTISFKDDARGMTPEIVRQAFFTVAGSDKSDLPPSMRSGGLGLAKMGFMLGSERLQLDTVRDGVRVTVDTTAQDIANSKFVIKKSPAPKDEHGTTVTVTIPEKYTDPKTGAQKDIYFPYSVEYIEPLQKPLIGPVTVTVNMNSFGSTKTIELPVGTKFPEDKYSKFKANFEWGSADIYFSIERNTGKSYSIKHQVLSSGVYQFSPDFSIDNEKIPYDIIVDVKPNVDARHPDYPFENSRERFKGRLEEDIKSLTAYLGQIARGYEASDLQQTFKDIVSMPRLEAGKDLEGITDKLKKSFDKRAVEKPAELKPLPKEVTITADAVTDTKTKKILVDIKAKEEEKKKESSFKGDKLPTRADFMIDMKQNPSLPIFHNNTNVDFLEAGRQYGEPEKFFAELGTLLVEMKEELAKSNMYGYGVLAPDKLFFAGISIDKGYGGVHIKVPYKAVLINPFYDFGAKTLFGVREQLLDTMIHEIAHTGSMDHGVAHNTQMLKVKQYLADEGLYDYYRDAIMEVLTRHESAFTAMRDAYGQSTTRNTAKSLEDYGKGAAAASSRGDRDVGEYPTGAIPPGEGPERGEGIREAEAAGEPSEIGRGPRKAGRVIDTPLFNVQEEPSLAEQEGELIFGSAGRKEQIQEYARLRRLIGRVPREVAAGKASIDMQRNVTRLIEASRELQASIKATAPRRDAPEDFLAKALTEYTKGNISEDVLRVIQTAYARHPELLDGLLLSVRKPSKGSTVAGQFEKFDRIVTLFKQSEGVSNPRTIRHELTHTMEQMMLPEQRAVIIQAWGKALQTAIKKHTDLKHQDYFNAIFAFLDSPSLRTFQDALALLPSYDMYQFINPSEYWAVNAEPLMEAQLGSAWDKFKRAMRRLFEGLKNILGFDNKYAVHKTFKDVMTGSKERITRQLLVDMIVDGAGREAVGPVPNIDEEKALMDKYQRPNTPMLDNAPVKTAIIDTMKNGKDVFKAAIADPKQAIIGSGNFVLDGLLAMRNKAVWYGAGLESRDFARYGGALQTSEGAATASLALDNAIRSGNIGVEVIFRGGIEYNPNTKNFMAVERDLGMKGVYEAEAALRKRLGDQLGTNIIQGYLEAKRSFSIMNEQADRQAELEDAKENLQAMQALGFDPEEIVVAKARVAELEDDLKAINKAVSSVNMSEEEMSEFADLDQKHPELRKIMNNWTAINQNLLRFWRQVGLLSQGRYDTLSKIKDYVPWYRIMNDEEDLHSSQQAIESTTRSMTKIGLEKLFKRGRPVVVTDFTAKEGQKIFKIQPAAGIRVTVNDEPVDSALISATPDGEVRLDMDLKEGDFVVFETNREIQNIIDNMTRNVMRMTMNGIRQFAANRIVLEYATRNQEGKVRRYPSVDPARNRFNWVVNGKKVVVEIEDPLVAASIYGMENINLQMWRPMAAVANLTRRSITLSGVFQVKQVFKDAPTAAMVTGVRNPLALIGGVWKGFLTSLVQPAIKKGGADIEPVVDILKAAGIGGFQSPARTPEAELKRRMGIMNRNVFSAVIKGLDHIGDSSDMAQRVATYKRVLAETGDEAQALFQAANVINFLHHGSSGFAQAAVKLVPFLGAYANSTDVLVNALMGGGLKGVNRRKALARLAVTTSILSSLTLLYCMLMGGDPEYDELDDQLKLRNVFIPGTKIMMPMNTSAALFFKAIPELIYNAVTREGTKNELDRQRLRRALAEVARDSLLGPEPVPAGAKQILEIGINHNFFTGRPITPPALKDVEAAEQYVASTSELGKTISAMLAIPGTDGKRVLNPMEADHLVRGLFGTAGAMTQWISNSIGTVAETRPEPSPRERPITGSFLRDEVPRGREDLFYDLKEQVMAKYSTFNKMIEREDEAAAEKYLAKNENLIELYEYITEVEQGLQDVNQEIRRVGTTRSKEMTPQQRRAELVKLQKEKLGLFDEVKEMRRQAFKSTE